MKIMKYYSTNKLFILYVFSILITCRVFSQQLICENRQPEGPNSQKTIGDGTFSIVIVGPEASNGFYVPNEVYTVTIKGLKTRYRTKKFLEFLLVAESEKQAMMGHTGLITTGIFHTVDDTVTRFSDYCPDGITSANLRPKSEISVLWTAPSSLIASCITFKATVVERPQLWYMDDGDLTKILCPYVSQVQPTISKKIIEQENSVVENKVNSNIIEAKKCCACDEAKYDVTFEGIWSKETHPKDFPENKWLLHFSDIIGASHSNQYYFWKIGDIASEGIRHVAEWGATRHLEIELKAKSKEINTIIKARGLWHPNEKGQTSAAFRVDRSRHLMSLVSMIGPSPDWFVGVSGYDLCLSNCTWLEEARVDLYPYDAGTDRGISYMSPNEPMVPADVIRKLTESYPNDTRAPFYEPSGDIMKPLAKLYLRRQRIYPKSCENTQLSETVHEIIVSENTEDVGRPECAVSDWSSWSACSVTCGKGLRMRKRSYMIPFKADMMRCDRQLEEKEMCLGANPTCENDESEEGDDSDVCQVTRWSEWTPCDRSCGKGKKSRNRRYKNHLGRKKCQVELTQVVDCSEIPVNCPQNHVENETSDGDSGECPVTPWSEFSPCSSSCGPGFRERSRYFLLPTDEPLPLNCKNIDLVQNISCTGEYGPTCTLSMEEAKGICMLNPEAGPCRFWEEQFAFSIEKGMCVPFQYGGCKGNRNRFKSQEECNKVCGFLSFNNVTSNEQLLREEISATTTTLTPTTFKETTSTNKASSELLPDLIIEPIDCLLSKFSDWSECIGECGEIGYMTRSREIILEAKDGSLREGKKCPKHLRKRRTCRVDPC